MKETRRIESVAETLWRELDGDTELLAGVAFSGDAGELPSVYPVSDFAAATIGLATLAVAEWDALRTGRPLAPVRIDCTHASVAFRSERFLERPGIPWPPLWDPMAGDYATRDGFVRLHTNYPHHRAAAERVLGSGEDRALLSRRIGKLSATEIEADVFAAGGCAAALRSPVEWAEHPQGRLLRARPCIERIEFEGHASASTPDAAPSSTPGRPLGGLRVLDLTRVIAGPTCTRLLAAWGAEVLRIDPVGFEEPDALLADTTPGKRCAALDLREAEGRHRFEGLLAQADLLVLGYRSDALARLGYDDATLRRLRPGLVVVSLDAYGFEGPWSTRRGFDSLVQMSSGIAFRGQSVFETAMPKPLPAQALDHGSGYLMASAACRSLCETRRGGSLAGARLSLAGTAHALMSMGETGDPECPDPDAQGAKPYLVEEQSAFGFIRRVACPGRIGEARPAWRRPAGRLGRDEARFEVRA